MKQLIRLSILVIVFSCSSTTEKEEWTVFDHHLLSIKYPSSWVKIDNDEMLLAIKKYTMLEAEFEGENPNIIISAIDTTGMHAYGHNSVKEYSQAFIEYQKEYNKKWKLKAGLDSITVNDATLYTSSYDVESSYKLTNEKFIQSQTHFHFESLDSYILIAITVPEGYDQMDVYDILNTLTLPEYTPLEGLLD